MLVVSSRTKSFAWAGVLCVLTVGLASCGGRHKELKPAVVRSVNFCAISYPKVGRPHGEFITTARLLAGGVHGSTMLTGGPDCVQHMAFYEFAKGGPGKNSPLEMEINRQWSKHELFLDVEFTFVGAWHSPTRLELLANWFRRVLRLRQKRTRWIVIQKVLSVKNGVPRDWGIPAGRVGQQP